MTIDMMWCDFEKTKPMSQRIADAIVYYEDKYDTPARIVRVSVKDHQDLGAAEFMSTLDLQPVIVVWSGKVHKHHMVVGDTIGLVVP